MTEFIYNKFQPIIGNGKNFRNVTFKENVVVAFFNILKSEKTNNKIYWIGDKNHKITINQLFKKICINKWYNLQTCYIYQIFLVFFLEKLLIY